MGVWLVVVLAGLVGAGLLARRGSSTRHINAGEVSASWLREQRAEKQDRSI